MPEAQILVVEDEGIVAEDISRQLKSLGYTVPAVASSGEEAIRKVFENKPDLVLMDILLKGEMDGIQATERINSAFSIPIVYLTAHPDDGLLQRAKQTEPFGYILKPFAERELYSTIETALYKHKADEIRKVLARQQAAVTAIAQRALQGADLTELMKRAVTLIAETLGVEYSSVWELLPGGKTLLLRVLSDGDEMLTGRATVSNEPDTEAGYTLLSDAPVIIEDFREERRFSVPSLIYAAGPISGLDVVIQGYERPFGVLGVHATSRRVFGKEDANFLQAVANVLGIAIERRRAETALWEVHHELERRVEQRTGELVAANASLKEEIQERKRAEEALGASEGRYRALFENAKDPIYVHDLSGIYLSVNPAAEKLSGYARDEILGKHFSDFIAPEYIEQLNASLRKKRQGELTHTTYEVELIAKNGRRVPVEVNTSLIYENGHVVGVQGMARDLTERKLTEQELRRRDRQLQEAQRLAHLGSWEWDIVADQVDWSDELYRIYGLKPKEIEGSFESYLERVHPEDRKRVRRHIGAALRDRQPFLLDERIVRPDGTISILSSQGDVIVDDEGSPIRMVGVCHDVTKSRQAEEGLRKANETLQTIFDAAPVAILGLDAARQITSWNSGAQKMFGWTAEETIGRVCPTIPKEDFANFEEMINLVLRDGPQTGMVYHQQKKSGERISCSISSSALRDAAGNAIGLMVIVEDITERKLAVEKLSESEERYRQMFEKNRVIKLLIDPESLGIVDANPAACDFYGFPLPEFKSKKFTDINTLPEEQLATEVANAMSESRNYFVFRHRLASGEIRDVEVHSCPVDLQGRKILYSIIYDITERRRAEQALKQSERDYRELFEHAHDAILIFTPEDEIVLDVNQHACEIYGFSRSEFIGMSLETISKDPHRGRLRVKETLGKGNYLNFETVQYKKDGTEMFLEINAAVVDYKCQRAILSVNRDISERKRVEEERAQLLRRLVTAQEAEQRRLSRELHDQMGQSVAALLLGLKSLDDSSQFQSPARDRLHQLQGLTNLLARDVHQLASSLRPPALDDLGLHTALSNYVEEWSERSKIPADFHSNGLIKERLPAAVETTVYRIVQESLTNVLKHAHASNVSIIVEHRGNRVLAIVEDDGRGFDAEAMMNRPMSERHLGLLGMKERVALVDGRLNIESTLGVGTTVLVHIPLSPRLAEENPLEETTHSIGR